MKKQLRYGFILILLLCAAQTVHAQWDDGLWVGKQANNWIFYHDIGLNFDTSPPSLITGCETSEQTIAEGTGTISDVNGNLLFSVSADTIFNKNHQMMVNGAGIMGEATSTQTGLTVPVPGHPNLYYVFSLKNFDINGSFIGKMTYSEVDMSLDNGLGAVTTNKNIVLATGMSESLTATYHQDGERIWVIAHTTTLTTNTPPSSTSNRFLAFLVSQNGVAPPIISSVGHSYYGGSVGQMKVSPDGSKIALMSGALGFSSPLPDKLQIFDFDNSTGLVSNLMDLSNALSASPFTVGYGLEFSPNSRYIYATEMGEIFGLARLYQLDLESGDQSTILASKVLLSEAAGAYSSLQLTPDGKIYMANKESGGISSGISIVHFPNNAGMAADFEAMGVDLQGKVCSYGLPGFIQSYFESGILYEGDGCPGKEVVFSTLRIPGIEAIIWDFGDGQTGTGFTPTHIYDEPGTYTVTAEITSNGALQTATTQITVIGGATATTPGDLMVCGSTGSAIFDLSQQQPVILNGQDPAVYAVTYHTTQPDAENNTNPIGNLTNHTSSGGTIYVRVTNTNSGCHATTQFELIVVPNVELPGNLELHTCSAFDLNIIAEQVEEGLALSYHPTQADAENGTNAITETTAYEITDRETTIYLRAENEEGCVDVASILLIRGGEDCIIPQGISPNGDQWNQNFDLSDLNIQSLEIFNRYGRSVFNKESYTNQWFGQTDNGDELPTGTYFYVIKLEEGQTFQNKNVLTGWVYVQREVN